MVKTKFAATMLCLAVLCAGPARTGEETPEVSVRNPPQAWYAPAYFPVILDVRSRWGGELAVTASSGYGWAPAAVTRRTTIPPGASTRVELTVPDSAVEVNYRVGGATDTEYVRYPYQASAYMEDGYPAPLACVNSYLLRELELLDNAEKKPRTIHLSLPQDDMPGRWQSYIGLYSMLVMNPREISGFRREQREAIARWVRWFGGRIWLAGDGAAEAAAELGLPLDTSPKSDPAAAGVRRHQIGNGFVYVQPEADALELAKNLPASNQIVNPAVPYFRVSHSSSETPGIWLLDSLAGVSTNIIIVSLLVLGLVMGPVNFWFIHRRKNSLLFFITTPLIALAGTVAIIGGTFLEEGLGSGYNQYALLTKDSVSGDCMLFDMRGVRSGFFVPTPRFSADSVVLPITYRGDTGETATDLSDGVTLAAGWLKPRFPSGFMAARPVIGRMGLSVEREGGDWYAVNDIGYQVSEVAALFPDGAYGWTENLAPGERKKFRSIADDERLLSLYQGVRRLTDDRPAFRGVTLVARCEGLPYLEEGGMDSRRLSGEYYYAVVGAGEGVGP